MQGEQHDRSKVKSRYPWQNTFAFGPWMSLNIALYSYCLEKTRVVYTSPRVARFNLMRPAQEENSALEHYTGVTPGAVITLPGDEDIGATLRDGFPTVSPTALEASLEQIHQSHLK